MRGASCRRISSRSRTITERYGKNFIPEDCTSQDWGVTYDEFEPYYDQFEHIYGVGGKAGNLNGEIQPGGNPHEGPRSREYPNPPDARDDARASSSPRPRASWATRRSRGPRRR